MRERLDLSTLALHADDGIESTSDIAPPVHVSTTFAADNADQLVYSRHDQPTRRRLEAVLGAMEGGFATVYSSGQAAASAALRHINPRRVAIDRGYFGTHDLLKHLAARGVQVVPLPTDLASGDLVWLETPKNPACEVEDIAEYAASARRADATVVVDSTLATPVLQNPLQLGAHVVMHSTTKFLCGHSDAVGGVLVVPESDIAAALHEDRETTGAVPGALETWLTLRSLRTLELRVRRQSETATRIAQWLSSRVDHVSRVWHPSLSDHPGHDIARKQMRGPGGVLAFELRDAGFAQSLPSRTHLFRDATSLGGVESLLDWRHKFDQTIPPTMLRMSVGLEAANDLIADLKQALESL